jgi:hypothetical protein
MFSPLDYFKHSVAGVHIRSPTGTYPPNQRSDRIWGPLKFILFSHAAKQSARAFFFSSFSFLPPLPSPPLPSPPTLVAAVNELLLPILDSCLSLPWALF